MTRLFAASALALFALACGGDTGDGDTGATELTEAEFKAAFEEAVCAQQAACNGVECTGSETFITDQNGCTYDASYADQCLTGMACDDAQTMGVAVPIACIQAYACE